MAAETFAGFARRVRTSRQAVSAAANVGRLAKSIGLDRRGRRCIVDVELALREWRDNSSRVTHAPIRYARSRRRARGTILVPSEQFSVSVWDEVILLARVRADGEPLYLMPMARETAVALASRLLELAGNDDGDDVETDRETP